MVGGIHTHLDENLTAPCENWQLGNGVIHIEDALLSRSLENRHLREMVVFSVPQGVELKVPPLLDSDGSTSALFQIATAEINQVNQVAMLCNGR